MTCLTTIRVFDSVYKVEKTCLMRISYDCGYKLRRRGSTKFPTPFKRRVEPSSSSSGFFAFPSDPECKFHAFVEYPLHYEFTDTQITNRQSPI